MKFSKTLIACTMLFAFISHNIKPNNNQYSMTNSSCELSEDEQLTMLCNPILFTRKGVSHFLKDIFSSRCYHEDFLPHNFTHFIEFLEHGKATNQTKLYVQSTVRLFSNKLKCSRYVTAYAFCDMVEKLPDLLDGYFREQPTSALTRFKNSVKKTLYDWFLSKFSLFQSEPDDFFEGLSEDIATQIARSATVEERVENERLRQSLIRFLEIGLNKLVWSPFDQEEVWESVKAISFKLTTLMEYDIISHDDLDDLFKSLIERFTIFLELTGSDLSLEMIDKIKEDITQGQLLLFELEEEEEFIETKSERMLNAVMGTRAKILAQEYGLITEPVRYR